VVGPFSYGADISRPYRCEPGRPTDHQKALCTIAHAEVMENTTLVRARASCSDMSRAHCIPAPGFGDPAP